MKIIVLGTRGIPNILGGVETHCQELYPRIVEMGHQVTVITRSPYVFDSSNTEYKGVKLKHLFAPRIKSLEAIVHTFLGILYAAVKRPDILHLHAVGPMLFTPFARLLFLKVIVTHHGPDYDRQKWGKMAKTILRIGESFGVRFANKIVVISEVINNIIKKKYKRKDAHLIYNGVNIPEITKKVDFIEKLGLHPKKYIIAVGRFVEEKGFHDLVEAYQCSKIEQKLVLVGDADHETTYSKELKELAIEAGVVLTGFIKGERLNQIFTHALLFVMPSYHEGLPIALLEAMSYDLNILVSDIPANLEVGLDQEDYFKTGDVEVLASQLTEKVNNTAARDFIKRIQDSYNWDKIALQLVEVYSD